MTIFTIYILKKTRRISASFWDLSVFSSHIAVLCRSAYPSLGLIKISPNKALECCRFGHKCTKMQPMLTYCLISFFRYGKKRFRSSQIVQEGLKSVLLYLYFFIWCGAAFKISSLFFSDSKILHWNVELQLAFSQIFVFFTLKKNPSVRRFLLRYSCCIMWNTGTALTG